MTEIPPSPVSRPVRPFYWSVRREIWENRSLYVAPLVATGVVMLGLLLALHRLPSRMAEIAAMDATRQAHRLAIPYDVIAVVVIVTSLVVAVVYCLGALHGERRDRSILFWKSLPVSDLVTVLAKAFVPMVVLPIIALAITLAAQVVTLLASTLALMVGGADASMLWMWNPVLRGFWTLPYGLAVLALWNAPIYGWLILVSGWARRVAFLWAVLPPIAICIVEKIGFDTSYFGRFLTHRLSGGFSEAFAGSSGNGSLTPEPLRFLASPDLWGGLVIAAALFAAAVWLRRRREPI
jgi:ABC-2 type transport system permease protein